MNSVIEEAEGDLLSSDDSWNKVEDDDDDDCVVDETQEGERSASSVAEIPPVALEFPERVTATSEHDESENGSTVETNPPDDLGERASTFAVAAADDAPEDDTDDTDAPEPTPVMSPAELLRANSIRSPDHSIVSPPATSTTNTTSQLFPSMNLVLPSPRSINLGNTTASTGTPSITTANASSLIAEHDHSFGTSPIAGLDIASPMMITNSSTLTSTANFAHVIRERTRQRRLKDDAAVASLRVQVTRLEGALAAACKRRVESMRSLQTHATTAVTNLETRLSEQVTTDINRVNERLNGLEQRMSALEARWSDDVCGLQEDVSHTSQQLHSQLQTLQHTVAQERVQASTRHERMMQQIQTVSLSYDERWRQERQDRMASVLSLQETMDSVHSERELNVATIEGQLQEELRALQAAVTLEQHERRAHDDDIVQSLNRYTRYIQESLAATTGVTATSFGGSGASGVEYDTLTLR